VRAHNLQKEQSVAAKALAELQQERNKAFQMEQTIKKLTIDTRRSKRLTEEAQHALAEQAEKAQVLVDQAREDANALRAQQQERDRLLDDKMRQLRVQHKVLGDLHDDNLNKTTRIIVVDTNWLITMRRGSVELFLEKLDTHQNLFMFIPCAVIDELDRVKITKPRLSRTIKDLIQMMATRKFASLIVHTTLQLSTNSLQRLEALKGNTDNQILEIYYEVVKCTFRTPILLTADGTFLLKVDKNRCLGLCSTRYDEIISFAVSTAY
jgi:multidrug efflux pump subunit AcrA (membrane-fusion protein)